MAVVSFNCWNENMGINWMKKVKIYHFAVEGSLRMQGLIKNLLDCS